VLGLTAEPEVAGETVSAAASANGDGAPDTPAAEAEESEA
jgi:hypothetical protein